MKISQWQQHIQQLRANNYLSDHAYKNAQLLMKNTFLFNNEYAMEPTQHAYIMKPITWQKTPNGDPEWLFMLKRQEYLLDLVQTFYETNEEKYLLKGKAFIFDWITNNLTLSNTWRTLDTGIRLMNWSIVVSVLIANNKLSTAERKQIEDAVEIQAEYLKKDYIEKYDISNWGVLDTTGILVYNAQFPKVINGSLVKWAENKLSLELSLQIDRQGMQWEQSPTYLLEDFRSTLAVIASYKNQNKEIPDIFWNKSLLMQEVLEDYVKPNGQLIQEGDTDAVRIDSLLNTSSLILGKPLRLQNLQRKYDFLLLELFHQNTQKPLPKMKSKDAFYQASGNYFWRSDWTKDADFWHVFNGNLGSGHGHAALGHIDLTINGQDVLVDPGRYTYVDSPERRFLKGTTAHNTILLDNLPFSKPRNSWKYEYVSSPLTTQRETFPDGQLIRLSFIYQNPLETGVFTRNFISLPKTHVYIFIDEMHCPGHHDLKHYWQLSPDLKIIKENNLYSLDNNYSFITSVANNWLDRSLYAPKYNKMSHLMRLQTENNFDDYDISLSVIGPKDRVSSIRKILPKQSGSDDIVPAILASAWEIRGLNDSNYLLTMQPENTIVGRKLYWYDGTEAYGTLNLFKRKGRKIIKQDQIL